MRIGDSHRYESALLALRNSRSFVDRAHRQLQTGTKLSVASDDPLGAAALTKVRASIAELDSYKRAIDDAEAWLSVTETAASSASDLMNRAKQLVLQALNAGGGDGSRNALASELESIRDQMVTVANSTYLGKPVFGGYGQATVEVVGGAVNYVGTPGQVQRRISPEEVVTVNTDGADVFGFAAGDDVFAVITRLADSIRAGDMDAVSTDATALEERAAGIREALGDVGARLSRLESARNTGDDRLLALDKRRSALQDADLAEAATRLAEASAAYESTLASIARLSASSLLDFLR